jgi:hypothetical protein
MACDPHTAHVVIGSSVSAGVWVGEKAWAELSSPNVQRGVRALADGCALICCSLARFCLPAVLACDADRATFPFTALLLCRTSASR